MVNGGSTEVDGPGGRRGGPAPLLPGSVASQTGALPGGWVILIIIIIPPALAVRNAALGEAAGTHEVSTALKKRDM
jgi:hypothetical protein